MPPPLGISTYMLLVAVISAPLLATRPSGDAIQTTDGPEYCERRALPTSVAGSPYDWGTHSRCPHTLCQKRPPLDTSPLFPSTSSSKTTMFAARRAASTTLARGFSTSAAAPFKCAVLGAAGMSCGSQRHRSMSRVSVSLSQQDRFPAPRQ